MINLKENRELALEVQTILQKLGLYTGKLDGLFGPKSILALENWRMHHIESLISDEEFALLNKAEIDTDFNWPDGPEEFIEFYGKFEFRSTPSGLVEVVDGWARRNLSTVSFPFFGRLAVHKKIVGALWAIGEELVQSVGIEYLTIVGCYNPRHKRYDPTRSLSTHAYAAAVDINWHQNSYGTAGSMHPSIVEAFTKRGAIWGGTWGTLQRVGSQWVPEDSSRLKYSDPMHFQFGREW